MSVVRVNLKAQGWKATDVSGSKPYDFHCTRGEDLLYVEVKGTTTDGAQVILTAGEVKHHLAEYPRNALAVVHSINLARGPQPKATGGILELTMPWEIDQTNLSPISYRYTRPQEGG